MPIIHYSDSRRLEAYPGVERAILVDVSQGALSLWVAHLTVQPGARVYTHMHPNTEEAMVVVEGSLEATLGDQTITLSQGDTVVAPAGVRHGFVNRSSAPARLVAAFPTNHIERDPPE